MDRYGEELTKGIAPAGQDVIIDELAHLVLFIAEFADVSPTKLAAVIEQHVFVNQYLCVLTQLRTPGRN